jgi:ribosomal protein L37E
MENIKIRCRMCGKELESRSGKAVTCGCPNMATIRDDKISAKDLSQIVLLNSVQSKKNGVLTNEDIMWQEARRQRKVKRLDYEVR